MLMLEEIFRMPNRDSKDELMEVLDYMEERGDWLKLSPEEREKIIEEKWMEIKWRKFEEWKKLRRGFGISEKSIVKALEEYTGLPPGILKDIIIRTGDVGSAAEYILNKQDELRKIDDL